MHFAAFNLLPEGNISEQGLDAIPALLANLINLAIYAAGALAVIFLIVGGFNYVISNGEPARIQKAKNTITYAIGGLLLSLVAITIVNFVGIGGVLK